MLVNKYGLGLQDPVTSTNKKYLSLIRAISDLIGAVMGAIAFSTANHLLALREEIRDEKKTRDDSNGTKLKELVYDLKAPVHHLILRYKKRGSWPTLWGNTVTGTVIAAAEFRDFLCARYDVTPSKTKKFNGCAQ